MNYFRKLVSGKRNRFKQNKYDLDITYVTKRVCGMSFPASGFEQVASFLEDRHKDSYLIFNLSCRKYDYKKFKNMVLEFQWEDHHSPALNILFEVCQEMYRFLKQDYQNIVIVNCNAGKGRTGTSIASFLMFSGLAENAADAITYYGWQRFEHGRGVTQPSQRVFKRQIQSPCMKILEKIVIITVPKMSSSGCTPYVEVLQGKNFEMIWSNKNSQNLMNYKIQQYTGGSGSQSQNLQKITINIDKDPLLCGDIYFKLIHKGSLKNKMICRFALNTAFIQDNNYEFTKATVDPDSIIKDERISPDFKVQCYFRDFCNYCSSQLPLEQLCSRCTNHMDEEIQSWKIIRNILDNHKKPTYEEGVLLNFNSSQCDFQEVIKKKLPIHCENLSYVQEDQSASETEYSEEDEEDSKEGTTATGANSHTNLHMLAKTMKSGSSNDEFKSSNLKSSNFFTKKGFASDTEQEGQTLQTMNRKNQMLNISSFDDMFAIQTGCDRRKSADFTREKKDAQANLLKMSFQKVTSIQKKQTQIYKQKQDNSMTLFQ